jgi:abhydrolase domain-containing protein 17
MAFDSQTQTYKLIGTEDTYPGLEVTLLTTSSGTKVPVFYLPYPNATITVLFSHGNASDCGTMLSLYILLAQYLKVNVVGYDYTGYGVSKHFPQKPSERQSYEDAFTVYQYILDRGIVQNPERQLLVYGQSLGSGVSTYLCTQKPTLGLVLHSPITSGLRVITSSRLLGCFDIFPNIDRIGMMNVPVFIIHGEEDEDVSCMHGIQLQEKGQ